MKNTMLRSAVLAVAAAGAALVAVPADASPFPHGDIIPVTTNVTTCDTYLPVVSVPLINRSAEGCEGENWDAD
ncbi:hypothetical protein CDO52_03650 [Nocardiopsis gilva YIM 90087]|uniref:Chaplin n=1 Tax=Nocardiopsis gilva YIM 90087 TaxID=1235441 RepID=A0A223S1K5_9ACTN|nr:hypothetical protein CDO52_03650 [Nocardiopsis gilva YIM 90087]